MAPAYNVGDFVWIERRQFEITDILGDHVELLQSGLDIPIYRSESKEYFELYLKQDTRNRQITDFLTADLDDESGQLVNRLLTDEDRAQIAHWLQDGEGNTQVGEHLEVLLDGRDGIEPDGLHYCVGAITLPDTATVQAPHVTMNTRQGVYVTYEPDTPSPAADTASA